KPVMIVTGILRKLVEFRLVKLTAP
ncbi:MAG: hypothetical protein JWL84_1737, partial [Rhodospirillales bacterium]|nr:hypothetical protein [Rhodospirillales bacterium]